MTRRGRALWPRLRAAADERLVAYNSDPATCRSPRIAQLAAYWAAKRPAGGPPLRADLDPAELKPLLPYLLMMDLQPTPLRVRYRLVGTAVAEASRRDFTGLWLDEMQFDTPQEREIFEAGYRLLLDTAAPVYGRIVWHAAGDLPVLYESAIFPLSSDGRRLDRAIALEDHALPIDELAHRLPPRPARRDGSNTLK